MSLEYEYDLPIVSRRYLILAIQETLTEKIDADQLSWDDILIAPSLDPTTVTWT